MTGWPAPEAVRAVRQQMAAVVTRLRLSIGRRPWRGASGQWLGVATGSSLEFQDHRPFLPGDDPRYLDWAAYARTGMHLTKVFRDEVAPRLDVVLDGSPSMWFDAAKCRRSLELFCFAVESALAARTALVCHVLLGDTVLPFSRDAIAAATWDRALPAPRGTDAPPIGRVPWRAGSLRVVISDLLFPVRPGSVLAPLTSRRGRGLVLAPYCRAESDPDWAGAREFRDCEGERRRLQRVDADVLARYRAAYARHFALWRDASLRFRVLCCQVDSEQGFESSLARDAVGCGAVEPCH